MWKTSIGSSAAATPPRSAVGIGSPNSMIHLDGSGTTPSGPSSGKVGVIGKYGSPSSRASTRAVALTGQGSLAPAPGGGRRRPPPAPPPRGGDHRGRPPGPDDRAGDDRPAGPQRRRHEAAAAEALQL